MVRWGEGKRTLEKESIGWVKVLITELVYVGAGDLSAKATERILSINREESLFENAEEAEEPWVILDSTSSNIGPTCGGWYNDWAPISFCWSCCDMNCSLSNEAAEGEGSIEEDERGNRERSK